MPRSRPKTVRIKDPNKARKIIEIAKENKVIKLHQDVALMSERQVLETACEILQLTYEAKVANIKSPIIEKIMKEYEDD